MEYVWQMSCPVWSESSLCPHWVAKDPSFLHADSEDWWDWADAQANLSLRWTHSHLVGFVLSWLKCLKPYYGNYDFPRFLFQTKLPEGTRCLKLNNDSLKLLTLAGNNTSGSDQVSMDPGLSVPRSDLKHCLNVENSDVSECDTNQNDKRQVAWMLVLSFAFCVM